MNTFVSLLFCGITLVGILACSSSREPLSLIPPQNVPLPQVKSLLIVEKGQEKLCEEALLRAEIHVLYAGSDGLLLTDTPQENIPQTLCKTLAVANEALVLENPTSPTGEKTDLATLLRLLPAEEMGARSFIKENPTYDGRGIKVAILDTGVEVDHPMLSLTTEGTRKITDFEDFSGEGRVTLSPVTVAEGKITVGESNYRVAGIEGTDFKFGIFEGSSLSYSEDVSQDTFKDVGVLAYQKNKSWFTRIDTNADKSFSDEKELGDFSASGHFTKLGDKKSLTTSTNVTLDGATVSLCFDDGTHGTHVAGITAGYDPKGLQGVAPGATVIAAKIGDNRLSGGSTTTASMLLAIDYAVSKGAHIINLSYGIRAGSNLGKSAIDQYVNKIAREKNILFSISAGNEGPGLLTIGVPAGADLAITNGAYVSKETAVENYGYLGIEDDGIWWFSSVGPRMDGGFKPSLLAPGSALSSVPQFATGFANYRGTSMASPETSGGLALVLSAAQQLKLATDRSSVTQAVYRSTKKIANLSWIEQGYGLFNVPAAVQALQTSKGRLPVEYSVSTQSSTSPEGTGSGIYLRGNQLPNPFTVSITPSFPQGTGGVLPLRTYRLESSAAWIRTPPTLWIASSAKTFQVELDPSIFSRPGLHSEFIAGIDDATNERAFWVPVTLVVPEALDPTFSSVKEVAIKPGRTVRYFLEVPPGTTAASLELETDGPTVWAQLLDGEGRKTIVLQDTEATLPQPRLRGVAHLSQAGVYELDLTAPPHNRKPLKARVTLNVFGFSMERELSPTAAQFDLQVHNHFGPAKIVPKLVQSKVVRVIQQTVQGNKTYIPFGVSAEDIARYESIQFQTRVARKVYDLMTDFPFRVFDSKKSLIASGGLEIEGDIDLNNVKDLVVGDLELEIQGAFASSEPLTWALEVKELRTLKEAATLTVYPRILLEQNQTKGLNVDLSQMQPLASNGYANCATFRLEFPDGRLIQSEDFCP